MPAAASPARDRAPGPAARIWLPIRGSLEALRGPRPPQRRIYPRSGFSQPGPGIQPVRPYHQRSGPDPGDFP
jgi:hypothetical protein